MAQIYCNGYSWLAFLLSLNNITYQMMDNAFIDIENFEKAPAIADTLSPNQFHTILDDFVRTYCPLIDRLQLTYHLYAGSICNGHRFRQTELFTGYVRYPYQNRHPHGKATDDCKISGEKLHGNYQDDDMGNRFNTRIEGTCIRHIMGPACVKLYDKFGIILKIETSTYDVSFFENYRKIEHK